MVLLTNPQTADLQQRIQNSNFGSPDYLQGFTGTVPGYQQNLLAKNFQPGLITRDFSGGATSMNPSGVANYLSYTPGVPPQAVNNNTMLPIVPMVNDAVRQGGGDRGPMQNQDGPGVSTEFVGDNAFRINADGTVTKIDPESIDYKLANFMNTITGFSPMSMAKKGLGLDPNADYEKTLDLMTRVQNKYGPETAMQFRDAAFPDQPTRTVSEGNYTGPTARSDGKAESERAADRANTAANQRNLERDKKGGGGGAGASKSGPEASGSGRVGSTGPTGRSRGGW